MVPKSRSFANEWMSRIKPESSFMREIKHSDYNFIIKAQASLLIFMLRYRNFFIFKFKRATEGLLINAVFRFATVIPSTRSL